jgi:hypothetical protein
VCGTPEPPAPIQRGEGLLHDLLRQIGVINQNGSEADQVAAERAMQDLHLVGGRSGLSRINVERATP